MLRVASYNIHKAVGTDRLRRPERIMSVLAELAPDIAILQEADRRLGERHPAIPEEMIAAFGFHPVGFENRHQGIGWHGNAILLGPVARLIRQSTIALPMLEPRGAVMADIDIGGQTIRIVGMHLALSGLWRKRQVRAILAAIAAQPRQFPTILAGDINEWSPHGGCLPEFNHDFRIAWSGPSFHARRPIARLDRIMFSPDLQLLGSGTHHSPKAKRASDHLPVWADFGFSQPPIE